VNAIEQLALGVVALGRVLGESTRPAIWRAWLPVLAAQAAFVVLVAFGAHPLVSWFMAPLLRAITGGDPLHYPELFQRLAALCARADLVVVALLLPLGAGAATRRFAEAFGRAPTPGGVRNDALALVAVGLPAVLVGLVIQLGLDRMGGVRISGISRLVLAQLGALVAMGVQAATLYVFAEVTLGRRSVVGTFARLLPSFRSGFLPALVVLALLGLPMIAFAAVEPMAASGRWHDLPELAAVVAIARALLQTVLWMLAYGVATLVWLGGIVPEGEGW